MTAGQGQVPGLGRPLPRRSQQRDPVASLASLELEKLVLNQQGGHKGVALLPVDTASFSGPWGCADEL